MMTFVTFSYKYLTIQSHDLFWAERFHHYYVELDNCKNRRDNFLFYVKLDSKQIHCVKMYDIMCNNVWCMYKMCTIMYANACALHVATTPGVD